VAIVVLLGWALVATRAAAYCRTITESIPADFDQTKGCYDPPGAIPLWWSNLCVGFSMQENASSQISLIDATSHTTAAFGRWTSATCPSGGNPSVSLMNEGPVACSTVEYSMVGPNQHAVIFRDAAWPYDDPYNTLALTTVTFETNTGELYDADIEINSAMTKLSLVAPPPSGAYDFDSIITHEAGHFLGLAHSSLDTAMMYAFYQPGAPALTSDDVEGICTIYPPNGTRATDQDAGTGTLAVITVTAAQCDPTPRHGFGSACGPLGTPAPVITSGGCAIAGAVGAHGSNGARGSGAVGLAGFLLALLVARRRPAATIPPMKRVRAAVWGCALGVGVAAAGAVATGGVAHASIAITVLFDELVRDSSAAAVVTATEQRPVWENGRIITYTHVHTDRRVGGTLEDEPWVRTMGGTVGTIGQLVDGEPVLTVGKQGLLFLRPVPEQGAGVYEVTARAQGQFPVVTDEKNVQTFRTSSAVGGLVPTPSARVAQISQMRAGAGLPASAPMASDVLHKRSVEDGVHDVSAAWVRIHGAK
jgi:hypothetical protein